MKRPTMLVEAILAQAKLDLDLSVERDVATLRRRCEHEGLSFLTITLPTLSDALEQGLESGRFSCPSAFASHGSLPRFLKGFFNRVFASDGKLLDDACPDTIMYIRQVCRFFKKLKIACSNDSKNVAAVRHFIDVEGELRVMTPQVERKDILLDKISGIIWSQVFPEIDYVNLVCHHGPGSTADRLPTNGRRRIRRWNQRSEYRFPSDLHCYPNYSWAGLVSGIGDSDRSIPELSYLRLKDELPVRVIFVPKTQTAPRVIAMEPSHMQFIQQSVKDHMYAAIEAHALTRRSIRFTRQEPNQLLAYQGSIDRRTSTLDLKDASDRVHLHLVQRIFKTSGLLEYLEDARSLHALLPDGTNIVLSKFASMGSATCFPVEACVFYTLLQTAMHRQDGILPSSDSIARYSKRIAVYGDDIVIPVEYTEAVVDYLESYALKVNVSKSFSKGFFRESCGADFYRGVMVNPIYARQVPHDDPHDWGPKAIMAWVATADLFYKRGMWVVAEAVRAMVRSVLGRPVPTSSTEGAGVVFYSFIFTTDLYWNRDLQCFKQKRLQYQPTLKKDDIYDDALACLNFWGQNTHLRESGNLPYDPGSASTRYRSFCDTRRVGPRIGEGPVTLDDVLREPEGDVESPLGSPDREANPQFSCGSIPLCTVHFEDPGVDSSGVRRVAGNGGMLCIHCTGVPTLDLPSAQEHCVLGTDSRQPLYDPLQYLDGDRVGLNFESSVKRGVFKSKRQWVSLAG